MKHQGHQMLVQHVCRHACFHKLHVPGEVATKTRLTVYWKKTRKMLLSDIPGDELPYVYITLVCLLACRVQGFLERQQHVCERSHADDGKGTLPG
jgi:hypothetical protein